MPDQGFTFIKTGANTRNDDRKKNDTPRMRDPKIKQGEDIPVPIDLSRWLTRAEAADTLRMSVSTIANHERHGKLHPQYAYRADSRGIEHRVTVYDPHEIAKLRPADPRATAQRDPGEVAARCFESFNRGMSIREVVIEQRETPERVQQLHESWLVTGGTADADLILTRGVRDDLERLLGPFTTLTDLLRLIQALKKPETVP